jgi:hypothetical protein
VLPRSVVLVLERDVHARPVVRHASVLDGDVELHDLADAQITQRGSGGLDGVPRGVLPRPVLVPITSVTR